SGPPLVAMGECANSLITNEPCYLRDRKVGVTQVMRGEIGAELTENFTEAQAFRSQPPRQRPAAHAEHLRDRAELRLAMGQERSDGIFDSDLQRTLSGAAVCQRLLAIVEQHLVEMRIRGDETKLLCFLVEDDPVCVRSKLYPASKEFFDFRGLGQATMNEMNGDRIQTAVRWIPAEADKRCHKTFHLLPIGMSGDASIAQGNREI